MNNDPPEITYVEVDGEWVEEPLTFNEQMDKLGEVVDRLKDVVITTMLEMKIAENKLQDENGHGLT